MIVPYLPLIFVMIIMFAPQHDRCRVHARSAVAVAWSHDKPSMTGQRSPKAMARCAKRSQAKVAQVQPPDNASADLNRRTIQQVTAAAAVAEQITAITAVPGPTQKGNNIDRSNRSKTKPPRGTEKTMPALVSSAGPLVVLLMARPEIMSVSDLTGKDIAIDDRKAAFKDDVRGAIMGAGASEIKLSGGRTKAINRLMSEKVPAAVLALVSADAAEGFPEIAGFKIFKIPLPPR